MVAPYTKGDPILSFPIRAQAEEFNHDELRQLDGPVYKYQAEDTAQTYYEQCLDKFLAQKTLIEEERSSNANQKLRQQAGQWLASRLSIKICLPRRPKAWAGDGMELDVRKSY